MPKNFKYDFYIPNICSIEQVILHMEELDKELKGTNLQNLIAFNNTYLIITKAVNNVNKKGHFQFPKLMEKLDIRFAYYYFDALKGYIDDKNIPDACSLSTWQWE